jgi:hypothetical protein
VSVDTSSRRAWARVALVLTLAVAAGHGVRADGPTRQEKKVAVRYEAQYRLRVDGQPATLVDIYAVEGDARKIVLTMSDVNAEEVARQIMAGPSPNVDLVR